MPGSYRIYRHATRNGVGTLVDTISAPATSYTLTGLAAGSVAWYSVRAVSACGVEQLEPTRRVRVAIDDAGNLITPTPNAPIGLRLDRQAGGRVVAKWSYRPNGEGAAPSEFRVYTGVNEPVDEATPAATTTYRRGALQFEADLGTFADRDVVRVLVRSAAADGAEEDNADLRATQVRTSAPTSPATVIAEVTA